MVYLHSMIRKTQTPTENMLARTLFESKEAGVFDKKTRFCRFYKLRYPPLSGTASTPELLSKISQFNAPLAYSPQLTSPHV